MVEPASKAVGVKVTVDPLTTGVASAVQVLRAALVRMKGPAEPTVQLWFAIELGSMGRLKVTVIGPLRGTLVAPSAGSKETTASARVVKPWLV